MESGIMNLGDGLLFELENGKPRLVLAKYGAESRSSNKKGLSQIPPRNKLQKIITSKHAPPQLERATHETKFKDAAPISCGQQPGARNTRVKGRSDSSSGGAVRVQSDKKSESNRITTNDSGNVAEQKQSLVCLTQEQFQQILSTINKTSTLNAQNDPNTLEHTAEPRSNSEGNGPATTADELPPDSSSHRQIVSEENRERVPLSNGTQSGMFSTFGERERERDVLEARRTQWRRELDEQMALKKREKASLKVIPHGESCKGTPTAARIGDQSDKTSAGIVCSKPRPPAKTYSRQQDLPAAIRSAFIVGEAAPVEDAFSARKEEQQRLWLQQLDQQREEVRLRRQQEKILNSQAEDHELWAVHFDSLHRPLPLQGPPALTSDRGEHGMTSSLSHHGSISGALSTAWEGMSVFGGDSLGRASVDTTQGAQKKSSHLRTMTALLDPAQIEEREHRKLKQLEHQRAIEAQVEERKRQKEKEEATRQALEQEEERRVERERELLQQQFMKDTQRHRDREELQSRKTEELYLSIRRAQEEAFKDKHLQRIRDLAKKGHDVSKLLRSIEGDSVSQAFSGQDSPSTSVSGGFSEGHILKVEPHATTTTTSPRKDTAVQTEVSHLPENEAISDADGFRQPAVTCRAPSNTFPIKNSRHEPKAFERSHGKENIYTAPLEGGADPYEPYARTDRNQRQQPGKRPEWNMQRPNKAFVPASARYPEALQKHRQESRKQRQMELMTLMEKNTLSRTPQQDPLLLKSQTQRQKNPPQQTENQLQGPTTFTTESRVRSPPIPAVKTRLQQQSQQSSCPMMEEHAEDTGRPPSLEYVPYVRTDEVYHMDPLAPLSRPATHEAQQKVNTVVSRSRQATPLIPPDPSPSDPSKNTERQQAILKGLSELRQGLLQRQREIETSLNPLLQGQHKSHFPPFRPV